MSETMLQNPPALGRLIGVSLGPGDPGLITRAAWAQLQRTDAVWTYPARSTKTPSYAFDIVQRAGLTPPAQHQTLLFPMTHDGDKLARAWLRAAQTVLPWLLAMTATEMLWPLATSAVAARCTIEYIRSPISRLRIAAARYDLGTIAQAGVTYDVVVYRRLGSGAEGPLNVLFFRSDRRQGGEEQAERHRLAGQRLGRLAAHAEDPGRL